MTSLLALLQQKMGFQVLYEYDDSGQKKVYLIEKADKEQVILKVIDRPSPTSMSRIKREVEILTKYAASHCIGRIPQIYSFNEIGEGSNSWAIEEQYISGDNLADLIIQKRYVGQGEEVKLIARALIETLIPLWKDEITHRDIKPSNIIISHLGEPILLDFGIALNLNDVTITAIGQPNTPLYAAPEQLQGFRRLVSMKSDMFSIGVTAYEMYYGFRPFDHFLLEQQIIPNIDITIDDACPLKDFFTAVLKVNQAERPRRVEAVLSTLN